jgi:hypothetical protein
VINRDAEGLPLHLTYGTDTGHAFLDRALYLPKSWTEDPDRSAAAGIPSGTVFATKPVLARTRIGRVLDAVVTVAWVAGDQVYGADPGLREDLETRGVGYVLAVGRDRRVNTPAGTLRADEVAAGLPKHVWQRLPAGAGAKGHRFYDWAWIDIDPIVGQGHRWLLIRRSRSTGELAFYRCYAPTLVPLPALVMVAGRRWTILAMLAHAFLAVLAATERTEQPTIAGWIALTATKFTTSSPLSSTNQPGTSHTDSGSHDGGDAINTAPSNATTSDNPPTNHDHHELRLEY